MRNTFIDVKHEYGADLVNIRVHIAFAIPDHDRCEVDRMQALALDVSVVIDDSCAVNWEKASLQRTAVLSHRPRSEKTRGLPHRILLQDVAYVP
jgi:hypothetical protein